MRNGRRCFEFSRLLRNDVKSHVSGGSGRAASDDQACQAQLSVSVCLSVWFFIILIFFWTYVQTWKTADKPTQRFAFGRPWGLFWLHRVEAVALLQTAHSVLFAPIHHVCAPFRLVRRCKYPSTDRSVAARKRCRTVRTL